MAPKKKSGKPDSPPTSPPTGSDDRKLLPLVGVGASAGGLVALGKFFRAVPASTGIAFIVVQHLDPTRTSNMPHLLSQQTSLRVLPAEDGMLLEPDTIYTIPADRYLTVVEGRMLRLARPDQPRGMRQPIDTLFYSMAEQDPECSVGVVLSGSGSDGSQGLRALKGHGGLAVVQDPLSAEYDGMPRSAIATGVVDFVLPPDKMLEAILGFLHHDYVRNPGNGVAAPSGDYVSSILSLLYARRNVDFSGYKKGTLVRRIERRMGLLQVTQGEHYLRILREDPDEVNQLFNDLLIQVTRFFRDAESWLRLENLVLARLVEEADKDTPVRVWIAGTATGEEAYSISMALLDLVERKNRAIGIHVFASDLDRKSLDQARIGVYPESIAADVSPRRLKKYFVRRERRYEVSQQLRDSVVFAQHNLLTDPPFSRLDLIGCRNVLIYLDAPVQRRILDLFHFGLRPGRFLFLGASETVGPETDLFEPLDKPFHIYRRLGTVRHDRLRLSLPGIPTAVSGALPATAPPLRENVVLTQAREAVLERYTAATVVVNRKLEILSLYGPTGNYLTQPSGALTTDVLGWVRGGTRTKLRVAIQTAIRKNRIVEVRDVRLGRGERQVMVSITVEPLTAAPESDGLLLIVFKDSGPTIPPGRRRPASDRRESLVRQLESELKVTRDELQASVEQLESSNEELRATNEEVLSVNEELQSANEELETSREELQSINEELTTVNHELELKIQELQELNDDVTNLLTSTDLPTLFLDRDFRIRRFTRASTRIFRLIAGDIGRPIQDVTSLVPDPDLMADAREVLSKLQPIERQVLTDGSGYQRRILPYRTAADRIEGVVVTYTDLSDRIRADRLMRVAREFSEAIVQTLREPLLVLDDNFMILVANTAFCRLFRCSPDQTVGRRIFEIGGGEWSYPEFRRRLQQTVEGGDPIVDYEVQHELPGMGTRVMSVNAKALDQAGQRVILLAVEDITFRIEAEQDRDETLRQIFHYDERERHRLALELHDETGQHVTAFLLGLAKLKEGYQDSPESRALIETLQSRAEELARQLHGISLQLRPTALDDHGLVRAMSNYVEDISLRHGLEVDLQTDLGGIRLPAHLETVLYRVTQEGLTNVLKHASSSKVSVVLSRNNREVSLIVEDDGRGFDPDRTLDDGDRIRLGLRGMRDRVQLVGGTLTFESSPGAGTTLFARIPLEEPNDD
jgi:two-component system, chemotaxis family, CheB/CheR fusion protein